MRILRQKTRCAFPALLLVAVQAANAATPHAIDTAEVAQAIFATYPQLSGAPVDLPGGVVARVDAPEFVVGKPEHWAQEHADGVEHIRLQCRAESQCLPFYAAVHASAEQMAALDAARVSTDAEAQSSRSVHRVAQHREPVRAAAPLLKAGDPVLLVIDSGQLHLRVRVTCMGRANIGDSVRVQGALHHEVYTAQVVDRDTVRGAL